MYVHSRKNYCLTPLQTYKVLKQVMLSVPIEIGLTPLQTYKVLKHNYMIV